MAQTEHAFSVMSELLECKHTLPKQHADAPAAEVKAVSDGIGCQPPLKIFDFRAYVDQVARRLPSHFVRLIIPLPLDSPHHDTPLPSLLSSAGRTAEM